MWKKGRGEFQLRKNRPSSLSVEHLEQRFVLSADSVVTFNEIMYNPASDDQSLEWVELYNQLSVDVDLSGWRLSGGISYTFPENTVLASREYLVVAADASALQAATGFDGALGSYSGQLSNGGERINLRDHNDRLMDSLDYGDDGKWPVAPDGGGATLAKSSALLATGDFASWTHSEQVGGTPGAANFDFNPQETVNILQQWNVDVQGGGGTNHFGQSRFPRPHGPDESGIWNIFNLPAFDGDPTTLATDPSLDLFDRDENPTPVTFAFDGEAAGWTGVSGGDRLIGDYLILLKNGVFGFPSSIGVDLTGLDPGATYDLTLRSAVNGSRDMQVTLDIDGDGSLLGESSTVIGGGGATSTFRFVANASGALTGELATASNNEANLSSFQLQRVEVIPPTVPTELPALRFNEVASALDGNFFIELHNSGTEPIDLTGYTITSTGNGGGSYTIPNGILAPGAHQSFSGTTLGIQPEDEDRLFLYTPDDSAVLDAVRVKNTLRGRAEQFEDRWQRPSTATPGAANVFSFHDEIVINEILYHHYPTPPDGDGLIADDPEEWIELYNNSSQPVDLSGWELDDAVEFTFEAGTILAPGAYTVITRDAVALAARYPSLPIAGEYSGRLSNNNDRIRLLDANKNIADEVHYYDSGRWSELADGNGSSLELRDPNADNSRGEAWAPSIEADKSTWETVSYTAVATTPAIGYNIWDEFVLGLLDAGEILIDDISVIRDPNGAAVELIQNGSFSSGTTADWRIGGNHQRSMIVQDPDDPSNEVLLLRATGSAEHILNHAETTLAGGESVQPGVEYQISYRARWVSGANLVNTRLYFNYLPNTTRLAVPTNNGTPGAANSQAETNIGPTYDGFQHGPVVPSAGEEVTVSVFASDPDGVASVTLMYSVEEGPFASVVMTHQGDGLYQGVIPGQSNGDVVQFYVEGADGLGETSTFPAAGADSRALYKVGPTGGSQDLNRLQIIMLPSEAALLHQSTNTFSNDTFGATVVSNNNEVFYDVRTRMKGSAFGRNNNFAKGFRIEFGSDQLFRGVHDNLTINRDGLKEIIAKHLQASAGGVPGFYDDVIDFVSASGSFNGRAILNMARYSDIYLDSQFENGSDGNIFNMELLYTPTSTLGGGAEDPKLSFPYTHTNGLPDFTNYGADQELYRHTYQLRNNAQRDDFSGLIDLLSIFDLPASELAVQAPLHMDVDQWVRTFAAQSLTGTDDTYTRTPSVHHSHNLRIYERAEDGLFLAMPWDLDRSFNLSRTAPLWGTNGTLPALFEIPSVSRLYHGHLDHLVQTTFNASYLSSWASHYGERTGQNFSGLVSYVEDRGNYVLSQLPAITPFAITTNSGFDFSTSESQVTITGSGSYKIRSLQLGASEAPLEVTWIDGTTWQVTIPVGAGANELVFTAIDYHGNAIESDTITVTSTTSTPLADATNLRVSELNYNPADPNTVEIAAGFTDNDDFEFIELLNTSSEPVELQLVELSVAVDFTFDNSTVLAPGERAVVVENQAAFEQRYGTSVRVLGQWTGRLSNGGETLTLTDSAGSVIQSFAFQDGDDPGEEAWPTSPDGGGPSLVVVDTAGNYEDGNNWRASSTIHGTPGADESPALPGDYNFDHVVDQLDRAVWRATFGSSSDLRADGNGDGRVDIADYTVWRDNLGASSLAAAAIAPAIGDEGTGEEPVTVTASLTAGATDSPSTFALLSTWFDDPQPMVGPAAPRSEARVAPSVSAVDIDAALDNWYHIRTEQVAENAELQFDARTNGRDEVALTSAFADWRPDALAEASLGTIVKHSPTKKT